jgi:hypothetical protein
VGHNLKDNWGVMLWKLNAAFPSVMHQIYDWYLEPNAGYFFMQNACESVHVQLNLDDSTVAVINRTYVAEPDMTATAMIFDLNGKLLYQNSSVVSVDFTDAKKVMPLSKSLSDIQSVTFVILSLKNKKGQLISHNAYWLAPSNDYRPLNDMPHTKIEVSQIGTSENQNEKKWTWNVTNNSKEVAFFIRPQLMQDGEEIMPSFWSAGYFTLAPSESLVISVSVPGSLIDSDKGVLKVSGWNIEEQTMSLKQ